MVFIFTSSIDYSGSVCNAAFTNPEDLVFKLKCLLKTIGWSVVGSGSGSFSAAYDLLPNSASMFASRSWFAIKNPNSNATFTFQRENVFTDFAATIIMFCEHKLNRKQLFESFVERFFYVQMI